MYTALLCKLLFIHRHHPASLVSSYLHRTEWVGRQGPESSWQGDYPFWTAPTNKGPIAKIEETKSDREKIKRVLDSHVITNPHVLYIPLV